MADETEYTGDDITLDDFTLESILAEYKGSAYINGETKTPSELLNEQTERIIKETLGDKSPDDLLSSLHSLIDTEPRGAAEYLDTPEPLYAGETHGAPGSRYDAELPENAELPDNAEWPDTSELPYTDETWDIGERRSIMETGDSDIGIAPPLDGQPFDGQPLNEPTLDGQPFNEQFPGGQTLDDQTLNEPGPGAPDALSDETAGSPGRDVPEEDKDNVVLFFENYRSRDAAPKDVSIEDVEKAVEKEIGYSETPDRSTQLDYGIFERSGIDRGDLVDEEEDEDEDEEVYEPELKDTVKRFEESYSSISIRFIPAALISLMMAILTLAAEAGLTIPFGIGTSQIAAAGALMIMLLIVMMLCADLIIRGASNLVRGAPNSETLILFSCLFSYISGVFAILRGEVSLLPYCAVSAVSLTMAALGEKFGRRAIADTLKAAVVSSEPYGVQAEYNSEIDKSVLKKVYNRVDGFYSNLMHPDISETAYRYASPILLAASLVLSALTVVAKGRGEYFLHILSAMLAAAAPFSAMLTFSIPFGVVARSIRKAGAAIAGWGGVDDICFTDGAGVTDDDLFPPGTLSFNGVKIYERIPPDKIIRYTASLIIASGSALAHIFSEVLKSQRMELVDVEDFACYEGGIGAKINGEHVVSGSAGFMHLIGIRIPDDVNMKNAVFTAIDNKLIAMFVVEYLPVNSVQSALISMLKWRIKLFFAMRDFNITPLMLEQKFRVSLEDIEYIQAKDSYSISDSYSGRRGRMAALLTREGLGPFAEAVTGGRLVKAAALVATAVSVFSAALGVLFMFFMCWRGAFEAAKPGNLLLFMLSTLAAVLVVCGYVKCKK